VNGGIVAAAADQVMGAVTRRVSEKEVLPATASLHIQFHLPALAPLTFRAILLGGGRRTKFIEVVVEDRDGNRCATSQGTMIAGGSAETPIEPMTSVHCLNP
jgi:acyl-coenzyme A thioesterase PaaI-like protein